MRKLSRQMQTIEQEAGKTLETVRHAYGFIYPTEDPERFELRLPVFYVRATESSEWQQVQSFRLLDYPQNCARIVWKPVARRQRARIQELINIGQERCETVLMFYKPSSWGADNLPRYDVPYQGEQVVNVFDVVAKPFADDLERFATGTGSPRVNLYGGRGGAKSGYACTLGILCMLLDPLANAVALRKLQNTLKNSVYNNILSMADKLRVGRYFIGMRGLLSVWFKNPMTAYVQQFACFGADRPESLKSLTFERGVVAFVFFEEKAELSGVNGMQNLSESFLRGRGSDKALEYGAYNPPKHAKNWANAETREMAKEDPNSVVKATYTELPREWLGERFLAIAEEQKKNNPTYYEWAYLGEPTQDGTQVFPETLLEVRPIDPIEVIELPAGAGADFGTRDPNTFVISYLDELQETLYVPYEWAQSMGTTRGLFEAIESSGYWDKLKGTQIACDHEIDRIVELNRLAGTPSNGASRGSYEWYGCRFKAAYKTEIKTGVAFLQNLRKIVIDPRCTALIHELENYSYYETASGSIQDDRFTCANIKQVRTESGNIVEAKDHAIDALRYSLSDTLIARRDSGKYWDMGNFV